VLVQLLDHAAGQAHGAAAGAGLGQAATEAALDLGDDLGHLDRAAEQVDAAAGQASQLPDAQAPVGGDQDQGAIAGIYSVGEAGDLGGGQESWGFALDPGQLDRPTG
jgi:hypothetical protein